MSDSYDNKSILYSDTLIPDIFIYEYLPELTGDAVKTYIYCCFIGKTDSRIDIFKLTKKLGVEETVLRIALDELVKKQLISLVGNEIYVSDIKGMEIDKLYKERTSLKIEDFGEKASIIVAINDTFFDGAMPIYMYGCIEQCFKKYGFEDAVMMQLFTVCKDKGSLSRNYIEAVAKDWAENNVKTDFDVQALFDARKKTMESQTKIYKALNRKSPFTQFETDIINKWFNEYHYTYETVEEALKRTVKIANPNIAYVDKILSSWHENNVRSIEDIKDNPKLRKVDPDEVRLLVQEHYQSINMKNSMLFETRRTEVFRKYPAAETLYNQINDLLFKQAFSPDKKAISEDIKNKNYELSLIFQQNNIPSDYLTRKYDCTICKDTGIDNGHDCQCKKAFIDSLSASDFFK
jgi:DnaD/phage-associated family protein